jgi:hypothetical protein
MAKTMNPKMTSIITKVATHRIMFFLKNGIFTSVG